MYPEFSTGPSSPADLDKKEIRVIMSNYRTGFMTIMAHRVMRDTAPDLSADARTELAAVINRVFSATPGRTEKAVRDVVHCLAERPPGISSRVSYNPNYRRIVNATYQDWIQLFDPVVANDEEFGSFGRKAVKLVGAPGAYEVHLRDPGAEPSAPADVRKPIEASFAPKDPHAGAPHAPPVPRPSRTSPLGVSVMSKAEATKILSSMVDAHEKKRARDLTATPAKAVAPPAKPPATAATPKPLQTTDDIYAALKANGVLLDPERSHSPPSAPADDGDQDSYTLEALLDRVEKTSVPSGTVAPSGAVAPKDTDYKMAEVDLFAELESLLGPP